MGLNLASGPLEGWPVQDSLISLTSVASGGFAGVAGVAGPSVPDRPHPGGGWFGFLTWQLGSKDRSCESSGGLSLEVLVTPSTF